MTWDGMAAEIVQVTRRERAEFRFQAPRHLLIVYEQGARHDGETTVEGLPAPRCGISSANSPSCRRDTNTANGRSRARSPAWSISISTRPRCRSIPRAACGRCATPVLRRFDLVGYGAQAQDADGARAPITGSISRRSERCWRTSSCASTPALPASRCRRAAALPPGRSGRSRATSRSTLPSTFRSRRSRNSSA